MFLDETDEVKLQRKSNVRNATCHSWLWENPFIPTLGLEVRLEHSPGFGESEFVW